MMADLRYALRALARTPGFTLAVDFEWLTERSQAAEHAPFSASGVRIRQQQRELVAA